MTGEPNEKQIRNLVENWAKAIRDVNIDQILANHSQDLVMFDVPPPLVSTGIEEYKSTWDLFFKYSSGGDGSFELVDLVITAGESVAFCHALLVIGGADKPSCRLTIGLRKIDGKWTMAHEHHSAPAGAI